MSKRVYEKVVWLNKYNNAVAVKYSETLANGNVETSQGNVNRYIRENDEDTKEVNPVFQKILETWSLERIDEETRTFRAEEEMRLKDEERRQRESREYDQIRKVFETKIEIFNIKEIADSKDRLAKSKIRRSKTSVEAIMHAITLLQKENENAETNSSAD